MIILHFINSVKRTDSRVRNPACWAKFPNPACWTKFAVSLIWSNFAVSYLVNFLVPYLVPGTTYYWVLFSYSSTRHLVYFELYRPSHKKPGCCGYRFLIFERVFSSTPINLHSHFEDNRVQIIWKQSNIRYTWMSLDRQLLRGTIVNRTYGTHKTLYISLLLLTIFGPIYYGSPYYY